MSKTFEKLQIHLDKMQAIQTALSLFSWDNETLAPKSAIENTAKMMGILSGESYKALVNEEVKELLSQLQHQEEQSQLTKIESKIVKEVVKDYEELEKISPKEYQEYSELTTKAYAVWDEAKANNDFNTFAPVLKQIIDYSKKFGNYLKKEGETSYDHLLKDYDECFDCAFLDQFFETIKAEIVPLLKEVNERKDKIDKTYNERYFSKEKQKEFCDFIAEYIGFDFNRGVVAESTHPFTLNLHNKDVRITNHYYEHNLESAILSVIHEGGHALYEMGISDELTQTLVGKAASMAMHESQSRMYENMIGRSKEFWTPIYPKLKQVFEEQLKEVTLDEFIHGINKAESGLIRTEADELSYTLHVIIRYEIEKELFAGTIEVEQLPEIWNKKYQEYLGVTPKNDAQGVLQDVHWCGGSFGYFPSYALGNAIAAQMYAHMKQVLPMDEYLANGNMTAIREYLNEHVHQWGSMKNSNEILKEMMGEELNASYYTKYLKEKFTNLYEL